MANSRMTRRKPLVAKINELFGRVSLHQLEIPSLLESVTNIRKMWRALSVVTDW
jgi:hypothetical protein